MLELEYEVSINHEVGLRYKQIHYITISANMKSERDFAKNSSRINVEVQKK